MVGLGKWIVPEVVCEGGEGCGLGIDITLCAPWIWVVFTLLSALRSVGGESEKWMEPSADRQRYTVVGSLGEVNLSEVPGSAAVSCSDRRCFCSLGSCIQATASKAPSGSAIIRSLGMVLFPS